MSYRFDNIASTSFGWHEKFHGVGVINTTLFPQAITRADGQPVSAQVSLFCRCGDALVASVQSSPTGEWEIAGLNPNLDYYVRIFDFTKVLNGAVLDWVQPIAPP